MEGVLMYLQEPDNINIFFISQATKSEGLWGLGRWAAPGPGRHFLRDYLATLDWNRKAPAPPLPPEILQKTAARYQEALKRLTA